MTPYVPPICERCHTLPADAASGSNWCARCSLQVNMGQPPMTHMTHIDEAALDQAVRKFPRLIDRCRAWCRDLRLDEFQIGQPTLGQIQAKYHAILAERNAA